MAVYDTRRAAKILCDTIREPTSTRLKELLVLSSTKITMAYYDPFDTENLYKTYKLGVTRTES